MENKKIVIIKKVIKTSAEITGAIAGGAVGLLGGPAGVIAGGAAGVIVSKSLLEIVDRQISNREEKRVGAVAAYTLIQIDQRLQNNESLRDDDFFSEEHGRKKASELLEGILIKSKSQYQEKKIRFISNIYTNTAFRKDISPEDANQILNAAETMTYRKMCILAFCHVSEEEKNNKNVRDLDYRNNYSPGSDLDLEFLLQDFMDLCSIGVVARSDDTALLDASDVHPKIMELSGIGKLYYQLLGLHELDIDDLEEIFKKLA